MSNPLPSALALSNIADGSLITASPHRNNYAAIQAAVNALITALSGGSANQVLKAVDGTDVVYGAMGVISDTVVLNGTVSYTAPAGSGKLDVEGIGAGGGGGGCPATGVSQNVGGAGGGGGAWARKLLTSNLGTHTVAVGAGGTTSTGSAGNAGGDTSFKDSTAVTVCLAKAGSGGGLGVVNSLVNGASGGGQGSCVGDLAHQGGPGGIGGVGSNVGGLVTTAVGGMAARGGGPQAPVSTPGTNGLAGQLYGGGGGGGASAPSQGTQAGGPGANGVLYIRAIAQ